MPNTPPTAVPTAAEIRQQFIDFFVEKAGHTFVPSSPVVPHDDPTLLFANAGMNQFKPYFLGTETPDSTRAANTQKCIRAGGKHNDLEDVGKDTYHHTFFEMLGNWSFGDYFKQEAIDWAWDLLVNVWGLDPERLHATYFEGDSKEGLEPDLEAKAMWEKYLPADRIHPGNKKDNFWEMGDTGPCGPCSELHYDRSDDKSGADLVNADDQDTVVEIWNLVFIQYNRTLAGSLEPLPAKHVDTGMGFERIVRVLQGKDSNYDTDVFAPLFAAIQQVTGARAYAGDLVDPIDTAYRIIADHIRTLTFSVTDGAAPSNEGRGYVLRRILRRAVLQGWQTLGVKEPFFFKLVPAVVAAMGDAFPELKQDPERVAAVLRGEEESFGRTIDRGVKLFDQAARQAIVSAIPKVDQTTERDGQFVILQQTGEGGVHPIRLPEDPAGQAEVVKQYAATPPTIPGDDAFTLYDTYGFPLDLTQVMAEARGLAVDVAGYDKAMAAQREQSKGDAAAVSIQQQLTELVQKHDLPDAEFLGYDTTEYTGQVATQGFELNGLFALVADKTPFYAESGGQVGDTGTITTPTGQLVVTDTQKIGNVFFHLGQLQGDAPAGPVELSFAVDADRRAKVQSNHTSTHLMNRALRDRVSDNIMQKGSLVDDEKLRFDFNHDAALSADEVAAVEEGVNADIASDLPVNWQVAPQEDALKINGLRAVFGEKYPPHVRVVSVGPAVDDLLANPANAEWADKSIEFCGGTHLAKTGDAQGFVIVSQEAVSKGVRRLTAWTGEAAHKATAQADALIHRLEALQATAGDDLAVKLDEITKAANDATLPLLKRQRVQALLAELGQALKQQAKAKGKQSAEAAVEHARAVAETQTGPVIVAALPDTDGQAIRTAMDVVTKKHPEAAVMLLGTTADKVAIMAVVPKHLIDQGLKAGDWVKTVAPVVGGGGGGKPDKAQAGGKDPSQADAAVDAAKEFASSKV